MAQSTLSQEAAAALVRALGECVLELTPNGVCTGMFGEPLGFERFPQSVVGLSIEDVMPADVSADLRGAIALALQDKAPRVLEYSLPNLLGDLHFEARIAISTSGGVFVVIRDVQARRSAEERLRESEERFRLMADHAPVKLWKAGTNSECDFFNCRWLEFTGRPLEQELGVGWAEGIHHEDFARCMDTYLEAFVERRAFRMEYRLRRADGKYRWILDQGAPCLSPSGAFEGYVGSCVDITDLRESGDEIRALNEHLEERVREREVLLREIHHRVKNNLQLISSLLGLNARQLDGDAKQVMHEGQVRIRSIALIHEKLYAAQNLADVDLTEYARDLVSIVLHAIGAHPEIEVKVRGEAVRLAVDQASPCGLVINELLTNALKHAFPDGRAGSVRIGVERESEDRVALTVEDDGVGLPPGFDPHHPKTLGLDVVTTLAEQLDAHLSVSGGPGTAFRFSFPTRGETA